MKSLELQSAIEKNFSDQEVKKSFKEISNELVSDEGIAYDFDLIKDYYCKKFKISSADALYFNGRKVYLIEFKRGFEKDIKCSNVFCKEIKESERRSIKLKALESELLLEKVIMDDAKREFLLNYIAVIDSKKDPKGAIEDIIIQKSKSPIESSSEKAVLLKKLTDDSLLLYRKETIGKHLFFDKVEVLYDYEFLSDKL